MLPFPGIPYPLAPSWCFPVVEGSVFALFALCLAHTLKRDKSGTMYLLGGFVFGVLLEYFEVVTGSYTYGHFHAMVGIAPHVVPLWVGLAWGIIMYTSRLLSDFLGLPLFAAAALDTLLALNIDLSIDVVAYRLHMWHWPWSDIHMALTGQWFGIPYGNFIGWATVMFCYSAFTRLFERRFARRKPEGLGKSGILAGMTVVASLGVLVFTEIVLFPILLKLGMTSGIRLIVIVVSLAALVVIGWPKRHESTASISPLALYIPAWFHAFFVGCFFGFGFYRENPWMTAAAVINLLLGIAIHLYPYRVPAFAREAHLQRLPQEG